MDLSNRGGAAGARPLVTGIVMLLAAALLISGCGRSSKPKGQPELEPGSPKWVAVEYWKAYYLGQDFALAWDLMDSHSQNSNYNGSKSDWLWVWQRTYPNPLPTPEHYIVAQHKVTNTKYEITIRLPNHEIEDVRILVESENDAWRVTKGEKIRWP